MQKKDTKSMSNKLIDIIDTTNEPNIIEQLMNQPKPKTTHGGRRANAGRKPSPYPLKVRNIKVPAHWPWNKGIRAKIRELMQQEVRA